MSFAVALFAQHSLGFELYSATLNGSSIQEVSAAYKIPEHEVQEKIDAINLALHYQARLAVNGKAKAFLEWRT